MRKRLGYSFLVYWLRNYELYTHPYALSSLPKVDIVLIMKVLSGNDECMMPIPLLTSALDFRSSWTAGTEGTSVAVQAGQALAFAIGSCKKGCLIYRSTMSLHAYYCLHTSHFNMCLSTIIICMIYSILMHIHLCQMHANLDHNFSIYFIITQLGKRLINS